MKSVPFRAVLLFLLAVVAIGSFTTTSTISPTTSSGTNLPQNVDGACSDDGITLIVEFGPLDLGSLTRCVQDFSGNSWELFEAAELTVEGTANYPDSFVCRIQDSPSADDEPCDGTPNVQTGSWVYFVANAGDEPRKWQRSPVGAASRTPKCGDSEAWVFAINSSASPQIPPSINDCS
jgi:hypothetical protein